MTSINIEAINELIRSGKVDDAIAALNRRVTDGNGCSEEYFLLGKAYAKMGNFRQAIYNYNVAVDIDHNSAAAQALEQLQEILDFYNTDLYNP